MLSAFALLLLMGAAAAPIQPAAALLAEEESVLVPDKALETEAQSLYKTFAQASTAAASADPGSVAVPVGAAKSWLFLDGQPVTQPVGRRNVKGSTYVALAGMSALLDPSAQVSQDGGAATVATGKLSLTAKVGQLYLEANGRYLYIPEGVQTDGEGQVSVPLRTLAKAFDAAVDYDQASGSITVSRGSGAIQPGDSFYNQNDLFWLERVIYRESGNQSLEGQMAVGNVVLNRVADPTFPNTVEEVLAQKNQFSTYKSGVLRQTKPSASSTIAAKLVMDGGVVEETKGATFFDCGSNSWAARNKKLIATFGDHHFYG